MTEEEDLREQLRGSLKNRALFYLAMYRELVREHGAESAAKTLAKAIRDRGEEVGARFAAYAPADFDGLKTAFLDFVPDHGRMFEPVVTRCDSGGLDIAFKRCPLKEAWEEHGLPPDELATMCAIAGQVDNGTFEAAGFTFEGETWKPGREGCCILRVRPGQPTTKSGTA